MNLFFHCKSIPTVRSEESLYLYRTTSFAKHVVIEIPHVQPRFFIHECLFEEHRSCIFMKLILCTPSKRTLLHARKGKRISQLTLQLISVKVYLPSIPVKFIVNIHYRDYGRKIKIASVRCH